MLAILKVNADTGRGHLDNFLPFIYHCLAKAKPEVISAPELQGQLKDEFGINLPQGVLKRLLVRGVKEGKVLEGERGTLVPAADELRDCDLAAEQTKLERSYRQLVAELRDFASDEFDSEWDAGRAGELLMAYIDGFSSRVLSAAVSGGELPSGSLGPRDLDGDAFVVHRFVARIHERDVELFEYLVAIVKGRMLADALYYVPESTEEIPSLDQVEVYLDGPLLLHLLGYAGSEVQAPYVELLEMLKRQGAIVRCFEHSVAEAQEILDAAARRVQTGKVARAFHGDVVSFLVRSGKTRAEVELLSQRLPRDLLKVGVQPVSTPDRNPRLQPDERKLEATMQSRIHYTNPRARQRDLDSLTAIHRLREGRSYRDLEKCRAILVAHNFGLFRASMQFFREGAKSIPLCVFDSTFTTLVWLREPQASPELPREQVLAHAYAALNPDDRLWQAFNDEVERLREAGTINGDDAYFLRFSDESRVALMDRTRGQVDAFAEGSVPQILERSRELARADVESQLADEQERHRKTIERLEASQRRAGRIGRLAGDVVTWALFGLVVLLLVFGTVSGPVGPIDAEVPAAVQVLSATLALSLAIATMIWRPTLLDFRRSSARWLSTRVEAALRRLFRL